MQGPKKWSRLIKQTKPSDIYLSSSIISSCSASSSSSRVISYLPRSAPWFSSSMIRLIFSPVCCLRKSIDFGLSVGSTFGGIAETGTWKKPAGVSNLTKPWIISLVEFLNFSLKEVDIPGESAPAGVNIGSHTCKMLSDKEWYRTEKGLKIDANRSAN